MGGYAKEPFDGEYDTVYSESGKVVQRVGRENKLWSGIEYAKQENKARHVSPIPFCRVWENAMAKRSAKERAKSSPAGIDQRIHLFRIITIHRALISADLITKLFT